MAQFLNCHQFIYLTHRSMKSESWLWNYANMNYVLTLISCLVGMEIYSTALWHLQNEVTLSALAQDLVETDRTSPQVKKLTFKVFWIIRTKELKISCLPQIKTLYSLSFVSMKTLSFICFLHVTHAAMFVTRISCAHVRSNGIHPQTVPIVAL